MIECDLALFNFDGTELDSGTVVEFILAKFLDVPSVIMRSDLRSSTEKELGADDRQETGRWVNNRAENSHLPFRRRERAMLRFRRMRSLQKFASIHASITNHFNSDRSLSSRSLFKQNRAAALAEWRGLCVA